MRDSSPRTVAAGTLAAGLLFLALLTAACSRSDPEKELRAGISQLAQAIEQQRVGDAMDSVAEDFTRESGAFSKQDARRVLAAALLRNQKVQISAVVTDLRIEGKRATVKLRVLATGGAGLLPEQGQTWNFDTAWRHEDGRWKVYNAEWHEGF